MRIKSKYILAVGMALAVVSSCKRELLDAPPQTSISDATAFDQPYRIANQVLALYSSFKAGTFYGGRYIVYGDIRAEEFLSEDPNLVTGFDVWQLNPTNSATAILGLWSQAYFVINSANVFIDGMNEKGLAVVGTTVGNNYIGEARLLRAISYYSLLQYYARPYADGAGSKLGLPLRLTGIKGPGASNLARSTVAEVYAQILADLDFAEANLPLNYSTAMNNTTRAHRNTAISFKTRVYLSMQNYAKVISEANKIVPAAPPFVATSGVAHALQPDITLVFKTPFTTTESIFSVPFTTTSGDIPGTQNGIQSYYYSSATGIGSIYSLNPAGIIGNTGWTATDKRRAFIFTAVGGANAGKKYLTKYPNASPADYTPVIRWAEVLLNLAEARARSLNVVDPQAVALLNAVRNRSDATTTFTVASFATAADLINAIMTERRIEFLGEGLRNNDIMRLLQPIPAKGTVGAKNPTDDGYIWPASSTEKSLNTLWVD
ncbi:MAG: RagB/SusD family nutrient uptake outer membrane protein [Chitinophagaceae bacterium]|nr:RagB/SusD family nutrient uptake outer membrane protein [Chitinophagaceae bacterium]